MILNELFNSSKPYQWITTDPNNVTAQFQVGNMTYEANFNATQGVAGAEGWWWFTFRNASVKKDKQYSATGTGGEIDVFKTVVAIGMEFVNTHKPKALYFSGDKAEGRDKLYTTMINMILKRTNGLYKLETRDAEDTAQGKFGRTTVTKVTGFVLKRTE